MAAVIGGEASGYVARRIDVDERIDARGRRSGRLRHSVDRSAEAGHVNKASGENGMEDRLELEANLNRFRLPVTRKSPLRHERSVAPRELHHVPDLGIPGVRAA